MSKTASFKDYFQLVKPGMVLGNLLPAAAGYFLASGLKFKLVSIVMTLVGIGLIMGAACAVNNLADRDIDAKMERTKGRPSASGVVGVSSGLVFVVLLLLIGFSLLLIWANALSMLIGAIGFIDYALVYTYLKRKSHHATLVGSIAGASPVVGAYAAFSGHITLAALVIGLMMLLWQMPHFYAISLYRGSDYRRAEVPVLPLVKGRKYTAKAMFIYSLLFSLSVVALYFVVNLSLAYLLIMGFVVAGWSIFNLKGLRLSDLDSWARRSFGYSLLVLTTMSFMVALR